MAVRVYDPAYLWSIHDADTVSVLAPLGEPEYDTWRVIRIRLWGLYAPELWTPEGQRLVNAVRERLFTQWTPVKVQRRGPSFNRWIGTIQFKDGTWWSDKVREVMKELEIQERLDAKEDTNLYGR